MQNKVRSVREAQGYTRQALATRAGISMQTLENIEQNRHTANGPSIGVVAKIAAALNVGLDDLFPAT